MMKPFRHTVAYAFLSIFYVSTTHAQQVNLKQSATEVGGPKHALLLCPGGDYLSVTWHFADDKDPFTIARYDPQSLTARYTNNIPEFALQHYQASMYAGNRPFIFSTNKEGSVSRYEINDKNGTLVGSPVVLFEMEGFEEVATYFSGSSPDKKYHYFVARQNKKKEKSQVLQGVILDQQMNKAASFSYATPEERDDVGSLDLVQGDNGVLSMIYGVNVKAKKDDYTPILYSVVQVDPKGKVSANPIAGLPSGQLRNFSWTPQNDQLLFTAFLSKDKKTGSTAFISGNYDPAQKKCSGIREVEIKKLLTQSPEIIKSIEKDGLPEDVSLLKTITLSDGSKELVLEQNSDHFHQSYYAPSAGPQLYTPGGRALGIAPNTPSYSMTYHHRQNAYVVGLDKANNPQWLNVVSKNQDEGDLVISIGLACIADGKDNVHIFFYDNKKNTEPASPKPEWVYGTKTKKDLIACVTVSRDGRMKKQMIEQQDPEWRLMFEKSFTETSNQFFGMSIKSKASMFPERFFKKASYRMTALEIK